MRKRVGTKIYDTDKAVLVDTTPSGVQVYRKKNSPLYFRYNPNASGHEIFTDLTPEEAEKYMTVPVSEERKVYRSGSTMQLSPYDRDRIKRLANRQGMSMAQFILMLVDKYEQENKDRSQ